MCVVICKKYKVSHWLMSCFLLEHNLYLFFGGNYMGWFTIVLFIQYSVCNHVPHTFLFESRFWVKQFINVYLSFNYMYILQNVRKEFERVTDKVYYFLQNSLITNTCTCNMYNCMFRYLTYTIHRYCFVMDLRDKLFRNNVVFIVLTWDCKAYLLSFQVNLLAPIVLWMSANGHGISVIHSNNERWNIYYFFQQVLHQFFPK